MKKIAEVIERLVDFHKSHSVFQIPMRGGLWIHEKMVCKMGNIKPIEGKSAREVLTVAISKLENEYFGSKREGRTNIEHGFPETFKAIESLREDDEFKIIKKKQVKAGIEAGYKVIMNLSVSYLLSAPIIFACLTDPKRGPSLARSIVHILKQDTPDNPEGLQYSFDEEGWGVYNDTDKTDKLMFQCLDINRVEIIYYFSVIWFGFGDYQR